MRIKIDTIINAELPRCPELFKNREKEDVLYDVFCANWSPREDSTILNEYDVAIRRKQKLIILDITEF